MRILFVLIFFSITSALSAQSAKLKGKVYVGETEVLLDSVQVKIVGTDSLNTFFSNSNSEGYYEFTDLPDETYRIEFSRKGFDVRVISGVFVKTNKITFQDARLERFKTLKRKKRRKRR